VNGRGGQDFASRISREVFSLARSAYGPSLKAKTRQHHQQYQVIAGLLEWYPDRCNSSHHDPWALSPTEYFTHLRELKDRMSVGEYQFTKPELVDMSIRAGFLFGLQRAHGQLSKDRINDSNFADHKFE